MFAAMIIFALSLFGIVLLFALKSWELRRSRQLAPRLRVRADNQAREIKAMLLHSREEIAKLPPELVYLSRIVVHEAALGFARFARFLERGSHQLADLVSHKHRFERPAPKSEFLRQVEDHKNGVGLDSEE